MMPKVGVDHEEGIGIDHKEQNLEPRPSAERCESCQIPLGSTYQGQRHR